MAIYDAFAARSRVGAGVAMKRRQARTIFDLGLGYATTSGGGILEIGPGDGYIAELSRAADLEYSAIEGSDAVARRLHAQGFRVIRGYVPPLPAAVGNGYRCCFLLHVLEHMKTAVEAVDLLGALRQRLAPGGTLVVACPDYSRWGHYFYDCDYTHAFPLTTRRLTQLLRDQGFELIQQTIYVGPIFGYFGLPLSWLAKLAYWPLLDDLIGPKRFNDVFNRGFVAFLPSILAVARRPGAPSAPAAGAVYFA